MEFNGYGVQPGSKDVSKIPLKLREPTGHDVIVKTQFCGCCHSDIHTAYQEWGQVKSACVPGHEVIGVVDKIGSKVTKYKVGDLVGIGCMVDSCWECEMCKADYPMYCTKATWTYDGVDNTDQHITFGGYAPYVLAHENYVLHIPKGLDPKLAGPLLCAGVTTYAPLKRSGCDAGGLKVGVIGMGGLGHIAVKWLAAWGNDVTLFTRTKSRKSDDAMKFGAKTVVYGDDEATLKAQQAKYDVIIDTVGKNDTTSKYCLCTRPLGTYIVVGMHPPNFVFPMGLVYQHVNVKGSLIGGIKIMTECLEDAVRLNVFPEIVMVDKENLTQVWQDMIAGKIFYRPVIEF